MIRFDSQLYAHFMGGPLCPQADLDQAPDGIRRSR